MGKGVAGLGKNVTVGTRKGVGKIGKGVAGNSRNWGGKSKAKDETKKDEALYEPARRKGG
jgi:hypothetical protein